MTQPHFDLTFFWSPSPAASFSFFEQHSFLADGQLSHLSPPLLFFFLSFFFFFESLVVPVSFADASLAGDFWWSVDSAPPPTVWLSTRDTDLDWLAAPSSDDVERRLWSSACCFLYMKSLTYSSASCARSPSGRNGFSESLNDKLNWDYIYWILRISWICNLTIKIFIHHLKEFDVLSLNMIPLLW